MTNTHQQPYTDGPDNMAAIMAMTSYTRHMAELDATKAQVMEWFATQPCPTLVSKVNGLVLAATDKLEAMRKVAFEAPIKLAGA